jgi:MerR family copper efflux transcriptional regulator
MKIGELARRTGVAIDTVRYYERQGLLPEPERRPSGYRSYGPDDVTRLHFIRRAKSLGFTLQEIAELLALSSRREDDMGSLKAAAQHRLADVEAKLAELARIRDGLQTLVDACPGHGALQTCPILHALDEAPPATGLSG